MRAILFFIFFVTTAVATSPPSSDFCPSWRWGVETSNVRNWETVPPECQKYVEDYMSILPNPDSRYRKDVRVVAWEALRYVKSLNLTGNDIWIFDIDETVLSNLPLYADHGYGAEPVTAEMFDEWMSEGKAPAIPETREFYRKLTLEYKIKVVFITARNESFRNITETNLRNSGFPSWEKLVLMEQYNSSKILEFKTSERRRLEERDGYRIIGNMGDQWSDLVGYISNYTRNFKVPNPMYYTSAGCGNLCALIPQAGFASF